MLGFQPALCLHPLRDALGPVGNAVGRGAQTVAVSACRVDVHFEGNLRFRQSEAVCERVFYAYRVIFCHGNEGGRRVVRHFDLRRKVGAVLFGRQVRGIDEDGEIGAAVEFIRVVYGGIGARLIRVADSGRQMASR